MMATNPFDAGRGCKNPENGSSDDAGKVLTLKVNEIASRWIKLGFQKM